MAFGVAAAQADRQARPEWESGSGEERVSLPAAQLLAVLRIHALALTLLDGLQAVSDQGGSVVVIRHGDTAPLQILMNGRRFPLPLGACAAVRALIAGTAVHPSPNSAAPAAKPAGIDAAEVVRASIVNARVSSQREQAPAPSPDPRAAQDALERAYGGS
jgi:hypothetical protein